MKRVVLAIVVLAAVPRPADACGVISLGDVLGQAVEGLSGEHAAVSGPVVVAGGGLTTDGAGGSLAVGWTWGERQIGGLFPGVSLKRVLVETARTTDQTSLAMTFGWQDTSLVPAALDLGIASRLGSDGGEGPIARLTLGDHVGVRLTGGLQVTGERKFLGAAELVVSARM